YNYFGFPTVLVCPSKLLSTVYFLGNRIKAAITPGVTARNSTNGQSKSFEKTILNKGLFGIFGTGGLKTTGIWQKRRKQTLIESNQ
ncbi:MAG: hypothetical protein RI903_53, partial [Bacteroidota bacterium]